MKIACIPDKLSVKVSDEKLIAPSTSYTEENEHTSSLDILVMAEVVKQRRSDALRIMELTVQATEALDKLNSSINALCKESAINDVID